MTIRLHDDDGVAMIVAVMVAFVVLLLSTVVVAQSIHTSSRSGYDRERLQSVNGAEAGLDYYYNYLSKTSGSALSVNPVTFSIGSSPGSTSVTVTPTYYLDTTGTTVFTGAITGSNYPHSVRILSVATTNGKTARKMASFAVLHAVFGGFTGAIVSNNSMSPSNSFSVAGLNGNDGDIYVISGNFSATSGNQIARGNLYVPNGSITLSTQFHLYGTAWANLSATVSHSQAQVDGDLKSTTSSTVVSAGHVTPGGAYYCTGSAPSASAVAGPRVQTCSLGSPPTQAFPQLRYVQSEWSSDVPSYTNFQSFVDCTTARNYIESTGAYAATGFSGHNVGNTVVRILNTCEYTPSNNSSVSLLGHLAIIADGSINLSQQSLWTGSSGSVKSLYFMSPYPTTGTPSCVTPPTTPSTNVSVGQNTNFSNVAVFSYSPCTVTLSNNNTAYPGQAIGGNVVVGNNFTMSYTPTKTPGLLVSSFNQDISYIREVK
jgi:Tfp pilus assembly protein PilX